VAHALAGLPKIDEALQRGELSYSKVRAMTRVATAANEGQLLLTARHTTAAQLEKVCRMVRQVDSLEGKDVRQVEDRRWVTSRPTDDGTVEVRLRLLPDEAARVLRAIQHVAGTGSLADGAVALAEAGLAGTDRPGRPPVEVVLHVDADTLEGRTEAGDGIPAETCRRLLCDAGIVPVTEEAGRTVDVGRKTRTIPSALRRALHHRDRSCRFPGCSNHRVDAHHIQHWIDGGATSLDNTVLLCRRHHRYLHEHGFSLAIHDGAPTFFDPTGTPIPLAPPRPTLTPPTLPPTINTPLWDGLPIHRCAEALL
jgi:hypothetical protein